MSLINFMASVNKNHMEMGLCEDKKGTVYDDEFDSSLIPVKAGFSFFYSYPSLNLFSSLHKIQ